MKFDDDDALLDALLHDHLRHELDPLVGRASSCALAGLAEHRPPSTPPRRRTRWAFVVTSGALAASIALAGGLALRQSPRPADVHPVAVTVEHEWLPVGQVEQRQLVDEGSVVIEDVGPARRLREEHVTRTTFSDGVHRVELEVDVPRASVAFVKMRTD